MLHHRPTPPWPLVARAALTCALRQFFWQRAFVEVDTPILVRAPAQEESIEAVPVNICCDSFARRTPSPRFFQTSPECAMKRLIAAGFDSIFQIAPVCRDGDDSPHHLPEFRMLEWYRAHAPYTALMDDCEALLEHLSQAAIVILTPWADRNEPGAKEALQKLVQAPWRKRPLMRITVEEAFAAHAGFSILDAASVPQLRAQLIAKGLQTQDDDTWDDLFHRAYLAWVEPALCAMGVPFFLVEFPIAQAALAQPVQGRPDVAERFELFVGGVELANAFGELTDAAVQRRRFVHTQAARHALGRRNYPLDEAYLAALTKMPPTSGIALGVERLMLLLLGQSHIDAISFIPWHDA